MLAIIPLTIIPFIFYNIVSSGILGGVALFANPLISLQMMSGAEWSMTVGDLIIVGALLMLFFEILKATRRTASSVTDHMMSMLVFVAYLVEFLLVGSAATQVFFILTVIAFIDVAAGFSISIRGASRDVSIGL